VLDVNTLITRLEVGPQTFRCLEHERVVLGPKEMLIIPPRFYCIVKNPVIRGEDHQVVMDQYGQAQLRHGDLEIRFEQEDPFPLYPGESLLGSIAAFQVVAPNTALRLHAHRDFDDMVECSVALEALEGLKKKVKGKAKDKGKEPADEEKEPAKVTKMIQVRRKAGDEWLFMGPATYKPRVEVEVVEVRKAHIILPDTAIKISANKACVDCNGVARKAGEQWLVKTEGAYMPGVDEKIVETVKAYILTPKTALQLRARLSFTDRFAHYHKKGEEWLVTMEDAESYIPDVCEEVVTTVNVTTLSSRQYCVIRDFWEEGVQHFGCRKLVKGELTFFLQPGESLENGIREIWVLGEEEALELCCKEEFDDTNIRMCGGIYFAGIGFHVGVNNSHAAAAAPPSGRSSTAVAPRVPTIHRKPGRNWFVYGPGEYITPLEADVVRKYNKLVVLPAPLNMRVFTIRPLVVGVIVFFVLMLLLKIIF